MQVQQNRGNQTIDRQGEVQSLISDNYEVNRAGTD